MINKRFGYGGGGSVSIPTLYGRILSGRIYNHWSFRAWGNEMRSQSNSTGSSSIYARGAYFLVPETITVDKTALYVSSSSSGEAAKVGWFEIDDDGVPTTLLVETPEIDVSTTGTKLADTSYTFSKGFYIPVVSVTNGTGTSFECLDFSSSNVDAAVTTIGATFMSQEVKFGAQFTHAAGSAGSMNSFPADATSAFDSYMNSAGDNPIAVGLRIA